MIEIGDEVEFIFGSMIGVQGHVSGKIKGQPPSVMVKITGEHSSLYIQALAVDLIRTADILAKPVVKWGTHGD